ncbi:MAG: CopD family protein, partial [Gammaproteobacteria bacterium]|nr:CopD family protein [Gammaproteobacteria bacterium]
LFYLPRLYVYHANASDEISLERFKVMEYKLYYYIMTPAGILATIFGLWILVFNFQGYMQQGWMHAKLFFVVLLWVYHLSCGKLRKIFANDANRLTHKFYRWYNEVPTLLLILIVILVVVKP